MTCKADSEAIAKTSYQVSGKRIVVKKWDKKVDVNGRGDRNII